MPIVGTSGTIGTDWNNALIAAVGKADFDKYFTILTLYAPSQGVAFDAFTQALAKAKDVSNPDRYQGQIYSEVPFDNVTMLGLAMLEANSVDPSVYNPYIETVVNGGPGAVDVNTFAEGKSALAAGKKIRYVGITGVVHFDQYHNSTGVWADMQPDNNNAVVGVLSPAEVAAAQGK